MTRVTTSPAALGEESKESRLLSDREVQTMTSTLSRAHLSTIATALWTGAVLIAFAAPASARVETLRWSHPDPSMVGGFRIHYGTSSRTYIQTIDVGKPTPIGGVYTFSLSVPDADTVYVGATAYGSGFPASDYSNEMRFDGIVPPPPVTPPITPPPPSSPSPAASWFQDFESLATGTVVPGWRDTSANNSFSEDDSLFAVIGLSGNRVLSTSSHDVNIHSHLSTAGSGAWSDYEVRGRMQISSSIGGVGVTSYSRYPTEEKYYRLRRYTTSAFELSAHGTSPTCAQAITGVVPQPGQWYRFRLEVRPTGSGNSIRAKIWPDSTAEPAQWQATCTDTTATRPTSGTIGVWSMGDGSKYWDDLEIIPLSAGALPPTAPPPAPVLLPQE